MITSILTLATLAATPVSTADELRAALRAAEPGSEIVLADGIYAGQYNLTRSGEPGKPITIRAANTWKAVIDPSGGYGDGLDISATRHVVVDGIRVVGAMMIGIRASAAHNVTIRNCRVELCGHQGIFFYGQKVTVTCCLVQRNGLTGLHHGIYFSGTGHEIGNNVIRHNAGYGLHGYGGDVSECLIFSNQIYGHRDKSGLLIWSGGGNFVVFNACWDNRVNYDFRVPNPTNRIAGNVEYDKGIWPLATRPE